MCPVSQIPVPTKSVAGQKTFFLHYGLRATGQGYHPKRPMNSGHLPAIKVMARRFGKSMEYPAPRSGCCKCINQLGTGPRRQSIASGAANEPG